MHPLVKKNVLATNIILALVMLLMSTSLYAQPIVTLTKVDPTCPADGQITVNATNITGTALYLLAEPSPITTTPQTGNHFSGLPPGTYTVHVYDNVASSTPVVKTITLTSAYKTFRVTAVTPSNFITGSCVEDGYLSISAADGKKPYTYEIESGPVTRPEQSLSYFNQLPTGTYTVRIKDACGASVQATVNVSSLYNLKDREIASVTGTLQVTYSECNSTVTISIYGSNLTLKDRGNTTILYSSNNGLQYRIEYPAGSGQFSDWKSNNQAASLTLPISSENEAEITYGRIEVKHPCTDTVTVSDNRTVSKFTPVILNVTALARYGICESYPYTSHNNGNSLCSPNRVVIEEVGNPANSISFTNFSSLYVYNSNDPITTGSQTYQFPYEWNKSYTISYYNSADVLVNARTVSFGNPATSTISTSATVSYYNCQFENFYITWSISGNLLKEEITITVLEGASHVGESFTTTGTSISKLGNYNDFLPGAYKFRIDFANGCPSREHTFNLTQVVSGGMLHYAEFVPGSFCGSYNLKMKWAYLNMSGTSVANPSTINDDDWRVYVNGIYQSYGTSNYEKIFTGFSAGTHRIEVYPWNGNRGSALECKVVDTTIVVADYSLPMFNVAQSGGAVCSGDKGSIHLEVSGLEPIQYQLKKKGDPDSSYSPLQDSPDFTNLDPGSYIARVRDVCGNEMVQEVMLISTAGGSVINASGASSDNKVCFGNPVTIMLKPIGPITSVKWTRPDGTISNESFLIIPGFQAGDAGIYHVEISSTSGCTISSSLEIGLAETVNLTVNDPAPSMGMVDITAPAVTAGSSPSYLTFEYYINDGCTVPLTAPNAVAESGTYYIKATSLDGCTAIAPVNVTIIRELAMSIVGSNSINEGETATVKIETEGGLPVPADIAINLTYTSSTTPIPNITLTPATAATGVTIPAGSSSVTFDVTANTDLLLEGLETLTITAVATGGFDMKPEADIANLSIADLTVGNIMVEAVSDAKEAGASGIFKIRFSKAGVVATRDITVTVEADGGTHAEDDFEPIVSTHIIPAHTHSIEINVIPKNNYVVEGNRTVQLRITHVE